MLHSDGTEDDSQGYYLDGAKHFRLKLPADVPTKFLAGDSPSMQAMRITITAGGATPAKSALGVC